MGPYGHPQWDAMPWVDGGLRGAGKKSCRSSDDLS